MKLNELQRKMPEITGLIFTHPIAQNDAVSEMWLKFKNDGFYIFIDFEQPFPKEFNKIELIGAGNALNCSDFKKDNQLIQYNDKIAVLNILKKSLNFRGNIPATVETTKSLFSDFSQPFLYC